MPATLPRHKTKIVCTIGPASDNRIKPDFCHFYDDTLKKLRSHGGKLVRLDAFAYLHKAPGQPNFFNRPGTWEYLKRLRGIAEKYGLTIFPEIHAEYGAGIHEEISREGYPIYDFFLPGLVIHALEWGSNEALLRWIADIQAKGLQTINMLGSHDGTNQPLGAFAWPSNQVGFLLEAKRVLRTGGVLAVDSPNRLITEQIMWSHGGHTLELSPQEWSELVSPAASVAAGNSYEWVSDLAEGSHYVVCLDADLESFFYGGGFTVEP